MKNFEFKPDKYAGHTKGPWTTGSTLVHVITNWSDKNRDTNFEKAICRVFHQDTIDMTEPVQNAILIADAPDILAHCVMLEELINTPELVNFAEGVKFEAAHQRNRWGEEHDETKSFSDWIAVLSYLIGKLVKANWDGDRDKILHHIITIAAVCNNFHAQALLRAKGGE